MSPLATPPAATPPGDPLAALAPEFHQNFVVGNPNFTSKPRWEQEEYAANFLKGVSPTFAQINPNSPAYRYQVTQLLDQALQPTTMEQIQGAAEDFGPAALATGGSLVAGLPGAAVGGALGSLIPQARPLTTGAQPPTLSSTALEAAKNATLFPLLDFGVGKVLEGGAGLFKRALVPQANEPGRQLGLEAIKQFGGVPGMAQRGAGTMLQFMENIGASAIPFRGMATRREETVKDAVGDMALALAKQITPILRSNEETSAAFLKETDNFRKFYQLVASKKYEVVDQLTKKGVTVDTRPAVWLTAYGTGPGRSNLGPVTKSVMDQFYVPEIIDYANGQVLRQGYRGQPGFEDLISQGRVSFVEAQRISSALKFIQRENPDIIGVGTPIDRQAGRLAGEMAKKIDSAMDQASNDYINKRVQAQVAKGVPLAQAQAQVQNYTKAYHDAKIFYRRNIAERFETEAFGHLVNALKNEPAKFSHLAIAADSPGRLLTLQRAAPKLWPQMQARILQSIIEDSVKLHAVGIGEELSEVIARGAIKEFDSEKFIKRFGTLGPEYVKQLTGGNLALKDIQRFGAAVEVANQRPIGQGKVVVAMMQGPAAFQLIASPLGFGGLGMRPSHATFLMITPNALSYIFSRPALLNMMERGLIDGPKSRAFARFNAFLLSQHLTDLREQQREQDRLRQTNLLPRPIGPELSQGPLPLPPPLPNVPLPPSLGQEPPVLQRPPGL